MTDDRAPYQRLDDAIHAFASALDNIGTVSSWTLAYELSATTDEPGMLPLVHRTGYSTGPDTSPATALGLHSAIAEALRQQMAADLMNNDEDDDQ